MKKMLKKFKNFVMQKDKKILTDYIKWVEKIGCKSEYYKDISCEFHQFQPYNPKLIAFYLPQFHQIKENNEWWEKGFTEWTNVTKTFPHFTGHEQPKLPIDVGFYDLKNPDIMKRQVELAKQYGISGFCFHYYWFAGQRLMEYPIFDFLNRPELDIEFCFNWANEDFIHNWNGGDNHVLLGADVNPKDAEAFWEGILPFFKDKRYIKIDNKPLLMIYKPQVENKQFVIEFMEKLREYAKRDGFAGLYITTITGYNNAIMASEYNLDAAVEFPPHECGNIPLVKNINYISSMFRGNIYDMKHFIENKTYLYPVKQKLFRCCFPSWDNTSRKAQVNAFVFYGETPDLYKIWLKDLIKWTKQNLGKSEQYVFINAWNEWCEGACLEPDRRYGYAYLEATKEALEDKE